MKNKKSKAVKSKRTFSWMNPKLEVRETGKYGKGVFAKKDIKKGEILAISGGYIMTYEECNKLPLELQNYPYQIEEYFYIGPKKKYHLEDNYFFNHSCKPNAGAKGELSLIAMRVINKDEEITFDYAMVHTHIKGTELWKVKCNCGERECRKIITENDWKIPELQKRYRGYFLPFIEEKIKKIINKK